MGESLYHLADGCRTKIRQVSFDLQVGDLIREAATKTTYKVTRVYPYIVTCRDFKGNHNSFSKADYICGEIKRVVKKA